VKTGVKVVGVGVNTGIAAPVGKEGKALKPSAAVWAFLGLNTGALMLKFLAIAAVSTGGTNVG
jgi:hypothetical protein